MYVSNYYVCMYVCMHADVCMYDLEDLQGYPDAIYRDSGNDKIPRIC